MALGELTAEALEQLLSRIDPDRAEAARRYEAIRMRLVRLFAWRGCLFPEDLADETMDRVARRLQEGAEVVPSDPWPYFAGVAYNVFREMLRKRQREREGLMAPLPSREEAVEDPRLPCLDRCLEGLPAATREFILRYHEGRGRGRIQARARLGQENGVAPGALRVRAHRIRQELEACIEDCVPTLTRGRSTSPESRGDEGLPT